MPLSPLRLLLFTKENPLCLAKVSEDFETLGVNVDDDEHGESSDEEFSYLSCQNRIEALHRVA